MSKELESALNKALLKTQTRQLCQFSGIYHMESIIKSNPSALRAYLLPLLLAILSCSGSGTALCSSLNVCVGFFSHMWATSFRALWFKGPALLVMTLESEQLRMLPEGRTAECQEGLFCPLWAAYSNFLLRADQGMTGSAQFKPANIEQKNLGIS